MNRVDASVASDTPILQRRLRLRLRVFAALFLMYLGVVAVHVSRGDLHVVGALLALGGGILVGLIVGRMHLLTLDAETNTIVARIDWIGAIILIVYFIFSLARYLLLAGPLDSASTGAALSMSIAAGVMVGRVLTMHRTIRRLLGQHATAQG